MQYKKQEKQKKTESIKSSNENKVSNQYHNIKEYNLKEDYEKKYSLFENPIIILDTNYIIKVIENNLDFIDLIRNEQVNSLILVPIEVIEELINQYYVKDLSKVKFKFIVSIMIHNNINIIFLKKDFISFVNILNDQSKESCIKEKKLIEINNIVLIKINDLFNLKRPIQNINKLYGELSNIIKEYSLNKQHQQDYADEAILIYLKLIKEIINSTYNKKGDSYNIINYNKNINVDLTNDYDKGNPMNNNDLTKFNLQNIKTNLKKYKKTDNRYYLKYNNLLCVATNDIKLKKLLKRLNITLITFSLKNKRIKQF